MAKKGSVRILVGLQRGDEGKGRLSDKMAASCDVVARYNGGPNAGHTIYFKGNKIALHQVPSGALYPKVLNIIGNGMYVDPVKLLDEIKVLGQKGIKLSPKNLSVSYAAHLILPHHILLDEMREGSLSAQGSTKAGIAYVAADKYERTGVRAELLQINPQLLQQRVEEGLDKIKHMSKQGQQQPLKISKTANDWLKKALELRSYITDTARLLNDQLKQGRSILAEGAQASWLDIDGGMYPYVTSSHPTTGGALNGLRIGHQYIEKVIGVMKAVPSHVGGGPFVTEITNQSAANQLRGHKADVDGEFGATTGRPRQVGWLDLPAIRTAIRDNGVTEVALTKLDTLQKLVDRREVPVAVAYKYKGEIFKEAPSSAYMLEHCLPVYEQLELWEGNVSLASGWTDLPIKARGFIRFLEKELSLPINMIGVGPDREQLIIRKDL